MHVLVAGRLPTDDIGPQGGEPGCEGGTVVAVDAERELVGGGGGHVGLRVIEK